MSAHAPSSSGGAIGIRLSAMMFLQFFVWGAWYVSMGPFLEANESVKDAIAWAYSLVPIAAIISPFFLGVVADRFFPTERVLGVLHLAGGAAMLAVPAIGTQSSGMFLLLVGIHALCYVPTLGLTNSLAFHNITDQEKQFPLIRVFGTIGWIVANIVVSSVFQADREATQFLIAGGAAIALGLYSFTLPHTPPPAAGQKASVRDILGLDALGLLKQPAFAVFTISSFLICVPLAFYYQLGARYVGALTGPDGNPLFANIASTMSFGQMSEIFFMLVMPLFFKRLGVKKMLLVGMLAWVVRYGLFAGAWSDQVAWMVVGAVLLHGICYDFFFVTGQIYVDKKAPAAIRSQAQGFLVLVTQGLGMFIGSKVVVWLEQMYTSGGAIQWQSLWIVPTAAAAIIFVLFGLFFRDDAKPTPADLAGH
jgi:nucleoside transporter